MTTLYTADEFGRPDKAVKSFVIGDDRECPSLVRWDGRFFVYDEPSGEFVEATPFDVA